MNEFNIVGKALGKPDVRESETGNTYATIVIEVRKSFKNKTGNYDTENFQVICFKDLATTCKESITDGSGLIVKGHLSSNNYAKEGKIHYMPSMVADRIELVNELY